MWLGEISLKEPRNVSLFRSLVYVLSKRPKSPAFTHPARSACVQVRNAQWKFGTTWQEESFFRVLHISGIAMGLASLYLYHSGFSEPIPGPKPDVDHMALPVPDIGLRTSFATWVEIYSAQLRKVQGSLVNIALYSKGSFCKESLAHYRNRILQRSEDVGPIRKGLFHISVLWCNM